MRRKPSKSADQDGIIFLRRVARGGSWFWEAFHFSHLMATTAEPWSVGAGIGFRVVCNGRSV